MSETSTITPRSIMLDTNVLLDYYIAARPGHESARRLISAAFKSNVPLLCAATSLKDFYYLFCLETKRRANEKENIAAIASELAWACVDNLMDIVTVVSMGAGDVEVATKLRSLHEDFEDDYLMATALRCEVSHFATSDKTLRKHATIPALSCDELLALFDAETAPSL